MIVLNIAEACGKVSGKDKAKYFSIARGCAMESGAVLDACNILQVAEGSLTISGKNV